MTTPEEHEDIATMCHTYEKEIESLRREGKEAADLWQKVNHKLYDAELEIESLRLKLELTSVSRIRAITERDEWERRYQILRDNLSPEEFGELCELWPELGGD